MQHFKDYYLLISGLKKIKRRGFLDRGLDADSFAAHTYGAISLGFFIGTEEKVDVNKVVQMLIVHDWVMAKMDDITPSGGKYNEKRKQEEEAEKKIYESLPEVLRDIYTDLFKEFNELKTKEGQIAWEADKLDSLFQGEVFEEDTGRNDILDEFLITYERLFKTETGKSLFASIKVRHEERKSTS